jgi:hypothetical protein
MDCQKGCGCETVGGKGKVYRQESRCGEGGSEEDDWEGGSNSKCDPGQEDSPKCPVKGDEKVSLSPITSRKEGKAAFDGLRSCLVAGMPLVQRVSKWVRTNPEQPH